MRIRLWLAGQSQNSLLKYAMKALDGKYHDCTGRWTIPLRLSCFCLKLHDTSIFLRSMTSIRKTVGLGPYRRRSRDQHSDWQPMNKASWRSYRLARPTMVSIMPQASGPKACLCLSPGEKRLLSPGTPRHRGYLRASTRILYEIGPFSEPSSPSTKSRKTRHYARRSDN
jgi:hypothetical protein